jgi:hypothetical protein
MTADLLVEALSVDYHSPEQFRPVPAFVALQRVVVRMLFDPDFASQVYRDPAGSLDGLGVPEVMQRWVLANDPRLWNADRLRRSRALRILMEEFLASSAYALLETEHLAFLDAFFSSAFFHDAVQHRRYLALAYAAYLQDALGRGRLRSGHLEAVLRLESGMAKARRLRLEEKRLRGGRPADLPSSWLAPRTGVLSVLVPKGTLEAVQVMQRWLFEASLVPALALCRDAPKPSRLPVIDPERPEAYLLEPGAAAKVEVHGIPVIYHRFLEACTPSAPRQEVRRRMEACGVSAQETESMESSLRAAGVLRDLGGRA